MQSAASAATTSMSVLARAPGERLGGLRLCLKCAYQGQVGHGVRLESLSENSITMPIDPSASYTNVSFSLFPIHTPDRFSRSNNESTLESSITPKKVPAVPYIRRQCSRRRMSHFKTDMTTCDNNSVGLGSLSHR